MVHQQLKEPTNQRGQQMMTANDDTKDNKSKWKERPRPTSTHVTKMSMVTEHCHQNLRVFSNHIYIRVYSNGLEN